MQLDENFLTETLRFEALFEIADVLDELSMRLFVPGVGGAPVSFHALLLKFEVRFGIGLQKIHQMKEEIAFRPGGIVVGQHPFQMIDVID